MKRILAINPGSTSTKIAVYNDEKAVLVKKIMHTREELAPFKDFMEQFEFRKQVVLKTLEEENVPFEFDAIVGRGGLGKPIEAGVYEVNQLMLDDVAKAVRRHACNLGCSLALTISKEFPGCRAFIADPGDVDELDDIARIGGLPEMPHEPIWHALNQRAVARRFAKEHNTRYEDLDLVCCHMGGGISLAAHRHGRAVDANNALDGDGPFTPERTGTLPAGDLVHLCFSGKYTQNEVMNIIKSHGGLAAHLGTNDMMEVERRMNEGDEKFKLYTDALAYQISKGIGGLSTFFCGKVDAIILTGGIAYFRYLVEEIKRRVGFIAPVYVYPGEDEMEALALNALAVLTGRREVKEYV